MIPGRRDNNVQRPQRPLLARIDVLGFHEEGVVSWGHIGKREHRVAAVVYPLIALRQLVIIVYHRLFQIVVGGHTHVEVVLVVIQCEHKSPLLLSQKLADVLPYAHERKPCELQLIIHLAWFYLVVIVDNDPASDAAEEQPVAHDVDGSVAILHDVGQRVFVDHHFHVPVGGESHQAVVARCPHFFTAPAGQRMYGVVGKPVGHRDALDASVLMKNGYTHA